MQNWGFFTHFPSDYFINVFNELDNNVPNNITFRNISNENLIELSEKINDASFIEINWPLM